MTTVSGRIYFNGIHIYMLWLSPGVVLLLWGGSSQQLHEAQAHVTQYLYPFNVHVYTAKWTAYTLFMFILFYFIPKMFCAGDRGTHLKKYLRGGGLGSFRTTALVYNTVRCRTGLSQSEAVPRLCVDRLSPVLTTELRKYWQRHRLVVPHKQRCYSNTQIASVATVTHTLTPGCLTVTHRTS